MKIEKRNDSFSKVGTVVFYKSDESGFKFLPDELWQVPEQFRNPKASMVKYHGSNSNFPTLDFAEYDFSYFPQKDKFNNTLLLSELDKVSSEIIGRDISDTSKAEKILFPTLVTGEVDPSDYMYFGSVPMSNEKDLYFFECPEDYYEIEIYEDILDTNISGSNGFTRYKYLELAGQTEGATEPGVIITLGPDHSLYNNPTDFYYENDPMRPRMTRAGNTLPALEYSSLCDELFSSKVVCFVFSPDSDVLEFNLSYKAFENNQNPLRNKHKIDLRNDEFLSMSSKGIFNIDDEWVDYKSGVLLGNTNLSSSLCPIKNYKLKKLKRLQDQYYSPYRNYCKGEITTYKVLNQDGIYISYEVESLVDGNIGNDPLLSPAWILTSKFLDFKTNIIYISQNPSAGGNSISPGTQVTVNSTSNIRFNIFDGLGYSFDGSVSIIDDSGNVQDLSQGVDYTYKLVDTSNKYLKTVQIDSWDNYINPESSKHTNNLVFNFVERPSVLKIRARKDGNILKYSDWPSDGIVLDDVKLGGVSLEIADDSPLNIIDGDLYLFIYNPENRPTLEIDFSGNLVKNYIESKYRIGSEKGSKIIDIVDDKVIQQIDFADSEYIVDVSNEIKTLSIKVDNTYITTNYIGTYQVTKGSDFTIPFNVSSSPEERFDVSIDLVNFGYDSNNRIVKYESTDTNFGSICPFYGSISLNEEVVVRFEFQRLSSSAGSYYLSLHGITENLMVQISVNKTIL